MKAKSVFFVGAFITAIVTLLFSNKALHVALEKNGINDPDSLCAAFLFFGLFLLILVSAAILAIADEQ